MTNEIEQPKKRHGFTIARRIVQISMLVFFALPLLVAGWGLFGSYVGTGTDTAAEFTPSNFVVWGSLASSQVFGINLLDPFAALQVFCSSHQYTSAMMWALPILAIYIVLRGRVYCGWVCPVNLFVEFVDWIRDKMGIKVKPLPVSRKFKPLSMIIILVLSFITSVPLFESISPIGALNRAILFGSTLGIWTLVFVVVSEFVWGHRIWCRSLCPLGGFYQVLGTIGLTSVVIDHDKCINCNACKTACLCDPAILDHALNETSDRVDSGDCMLCGRCIEACPKDALSIRMTIPKNIEL